MRPLTHMRSRINRRHVVSSLCIGAVMLGLGDIIPGLPSDVAVQAAAAARADRRIVWDVAIDCRTWRFNGGISFAEFGRGDGFIADGRLFPGGTLAAGAQTNDPNEGGSIGAWVQRGTMAATLAEIGAGARPAFFATWYHLLDNGSGLVVEGPHPETGPMAVVGGMGRFRGAGGQLSDEIIGTNVTGCPNLRLTIRLSRPASD